MRKLRENGHEAPVLTEQTFVEGKMPQIQSIHASDKKPEVRTPAVRTMRSDLEELLREKRPSLTSIIGKGGVTASRIDHEKKGKKKSLALIFSMVILLVAGGVLIFFLLRKEVGIISKLIPAPPLFATESVRTLRLPPHDELQFFRNMDDLMRTKEREGTITRLVLTKEVEERKKVREAFATLDDFLKIYQINPPGGFFDETEPSFMPFIYYGSTGARFGFALHVRNAEHARAVMRIWEVSLLRDMQPLFFHEKPDVILAPFLDRSYRNIDLRELPLAKERDLTITHTVFPATNTLVITTGKKAMETIINRLFDVR